MTHYFYFLQLHFCPGATAKTFRVESSFEFLCLSCCGCAATSGISLFIRERMHMHMYDPPPEGNSGTEGGSYDVQSKVK